MTAKLFKHFSDVFRKSRRVEPSARAARTTVIQKFGAFRELLEQNNVVLTMMADLEAGLVARPCARPKELRTLISRILAAVEIIVDRLNTISGNRYLALLDRHREIASAIETILSERREIPPFNYTAPLTDITKQHVLQFGNKNANLGEIKNRLKLPVPDGFAISTFAYKDFLERNGLLDDVASLIDSLSDRDMNTIARVGEEFRDRIVRARIPEELAREIEDAYAKFCRSAGHSRTVAVRSSGVHEDTEASFAGQHATFLDVPPEQILERYRDVVASLFYPGALSCFLREGFQASEIAMSVGVMTMVDARAAGVMYTRDPNAPADEAILISGVPGLGKRLVDGRATPAQYRVSRDAAPAIIERIIPAEGREMPQGDHEREDACSVSFSSAGHAILPDDSIKALARYGIMIEEHFGCPQDIEWAVDRQGGIFILQARPLLLFPQERVEAPAAPIAGYTVLLENGVTASGGIGYGRARVIERPDELSTVPEGAVLVTRYLSTRFVPVLDRVRALVTDVGAAAVHMATIARERGIPTLTGTNVATRVIREGQEVTVDATNRRIYEGCVSELIHGREVVKRVIPTSRRLDAIERAVQAVVPLRLIHPDDENFRTACCVTLHDITRFAHQKAMQELFEMMSEYPEEGEPKRLVSDIPLCVDLLDLEGCVESEQEKIKPEQVHSIPFQAFFAGLSALPWPEPRHVDVRGFFGMIAHTAEIPEVELDRMAERSFIFVSRHYMHFSIRLGYHLSVVEAYAGATINDNYIRFFFKGGGADRERRLRRVRLISDVLERIGFTAKCTEDVIDALLTKDTQENLVEKLTVLGKLTVYTKQMDAILSDDAAVERHLREFADTALSSEQSVK